MNILLNGIFENDFLCFIPEIFLSLAIMFILVFCLVLNNVKDLGFPYMLHVGTYFAILSLFLVLLLYLNAPVSVYSIFLNQVVSTKFILFFKILLLTLAITVLFISLDYYKPEGIQSYEYVIIYLLALFGMLLMISSNDFVFFYLSIELQSLALYLLAAYKRYSNFSTEAGLKYFVLGAFSSGLLLFGISILYGFTGLTNFTELGYFLSDLEVNQEVLNLVVVGFIFFLVGLLFKLAAAPFHMWAPDVYQGSPSIVTLFFSVLPKVAVLAFLIRALNTTFADLLFYTDQILAYSAVLSLVLGVLGAIYQTKIKRLLAYSAISHMGFMLLGLVGNTSDGLFALNFYLIVYVLNVLCIFSIVLSLRNKVSGYLVKDIRDLVSLGVSNIPLALIFSLILFSIGGIPPLAGFFSKFYVFVNLVYLKFYFISILGVLASVVGIIYYIRLIKLMFFSGATQPVIWFEPVTKIRANVIAITFLANVLFFVYPAPFVVLIVHNIAALTCNF